MATRAVRFLGIVCFFLTGCQKEEGCTDSSAANFNPDAEVENGTCQYPGCTDPLAVNYAPEASVDDGSCEYDVEGCTDPEALNYNVEATVDDGSCEYGIEGCTDPAALNYDAEATVDDGSCEYLEDPQPTIDGYTYPVVEIGDQIWFAENLMTSVYANGDSIPSLLTEGEWTSTNEGATAVYGEGDSDCSHFSPNVDACDEEQALEAYGRLYNWYAVDDSRGLCPTGWHVPTDEEWTELEEYIVSQGFEGSVGTTLKSTTGWSLDVGNASGNGTDDFGFSALPGGGRDYNGGYFYHAGQDGFWWSSSPASGVYAWYRDLYFDDSGIHRNNSYPRFGFSVRCLRDAE